MEEIASRFATQVNAAADGRLHRAQVIEAALQWIGGRPILNSVNLEDGDEPGTRLDKFLSLARDYGAAVVCTCIDEQGQARDRDWKLRAATQIHDLAIERYGLEPADLIFDALALTARHRHRGEPPRRHRDHRGHPPHQGEPARRPHHARPVERVASASTRRPATSSTPCSCTSAPQAGLDSAIVHASKILPLNRIPDEQRDVCLDLVYDRRGAEGVLRAATRTTTRSPSCSTSSPT